MVTRTPVRGPSESWAGEAPVEGAVLLVFSTDSHPSCRRMKETVEALRKNVSSGVSVVDVDPWERPDLVARHLVITLPTLLLLEGDDERVRIEGLRPLRHVLRALASQAVP